ncbi:MAG: winged helix-turn-helix transcriptional regulator [Anaerolineales bacterium]
MPNSTRQQILEALQNKQRCTIKELADLAEINPVSVRHHISRLEAEGLVTSEEERHGVGRPRRVYLLTTAGAERFPSRYVDMTIRLLEQIKQNLPEQVVERMFSQMARDLLDDQTAGLNLDNLNVEERLEVMARILSDEGFQVAWERQGGMYHIHETACPYLHVGQNHPEVCTIDQTLISTLLQVPVEKIQCRLHGDSRCTYTISGKDIPTLQENT